MQGKLLHKIVVFIENNKIYHSFYIFRLKGNRYFAYNMQTPDSIHQFIKDTLEAQIVNIDKRHEHFYHNYGYHLVTEKELKFIESLE